MSHMNIGAAASVTHLPEGHAELMCTRVCVLTLQYNKCSQRALTGINKRTAVVLFCGASVLPVHI